VAIHQTINNSNLLVELNTKHTNTYTRGG